MSVERTVPTLLGGLGLVFLAKLWPGVQAFDSFLLWAVFTVEWVVASVTLVFFPRSTRLAAGLLALLAVVGSFWPSALCREAYSLIGWVAFIVAVTVGNPQQRATLLKVCATVVYAFAAGSKLNPDFLNADQLVYLIDTRPHLELFRPLVESSWGPLLAVATVAGEAWMAIGMWWSRTRRLTIAFGISLHATLVVAAAMDVYSFAELIVLNGLLVVCYIAFAKVGETVAAEAQVAPTHGDAMALIMRPSST